jgi:phage terminase large subunit-like protein
MTGFDPAAFKHWNADAQAKALQIIKERQSATWRPFYCPNRDCDGKPHDEWVWSHARSDQRPPEMSEDWLVWLLMSGRGAGKTRTGSEYTHRITKIAPRIALVAATGADVRDTLVEGESGIIATSPPGNAPTWEPSKRRLTWPNGAIGTTFSAEEPDRLRGPQFHFAWLDEPAHYPSIDEVWSNLLLGLRLGRAPRVVCTTTPRPTPWIKALVDDPLTRVSRASTYANLDNLAETFKRTVLSRYEGTRLGRQELYGDILADVEGALWTWPLIEDNRVPEAPAMDRIVVAVDPAGSTRKTADETGIVVVGRAGNQAYVLADASGQLSPQAWTRRAINLYQEYSADAIVAEKNYGGDMVAALLRQQDENANVRTVQSRRGKAIRAEPIVGMYEQGRVHHVGVLTGLEEQLVGWVPGASDSPDRLDALVHGLTDVMGKGGVAQIASPTRLRLMVGGAA